MCNFFSCVTLGDGILWYIKPKDRKIIYGGGKLHGKGINPIKSRSELDSHSAICDYYGLDCDRVNKYEFRPINRKFTVDQINANIDDREIVDRKIRRLNFSNIAPPELIIKKPINPLKLGCDTVTENDLILLKKWASVWCSVGHSVGCSVERSVGHSVEDSVWHSVGCSVWAYTSSFFNLQNWKYIDHAPGENPFQSCIDLWEKGLVPSFDGNIWRLHGSEGKILKELTKLDLAEYK